MGLLRKILLCFCCGVALLLTGCDGIVANPSTLMSPPMLSGERQGVWESLKSILGNKISLCYPTGGKYKDAMVMKNFIISGNSSAVVFYQDASMTVRIAVMEKVDGKWLINSDVGTSASAVDFVDFSGNHLVVGLDISQKKEKQIIIYSFGSGRATPIYTDTYTAASLTDIDRDGVVDVLLVKDDVAQDSFVVEHIAREGNTYYLQSKIPINASVTSIVQVLTGTTASGETALFLDGKIGQKNMMTQLALVREGVLVNPLESEEEYKKTIRSDALPCMNNAHGIVEIPTQSLLSGYSMSSQPRYLTDWYTYTTEGLAYAHSAFVAQDLGFSIEVPQDLRDKITFRYAYDGSQVQILSAGAQAIEDNEAVLGAVGVFSKNQTYLNGFTKVEEVGTTIYGVAAYGSSDQPGYQSVEALERRFSVLQW